jgi:hypothetical protein
MSIDTPARKRVNSTPDSRLVGRNFTTLRARPGFPRTGLGATACWAQVARELCENTLPVAVVAGLDGVLSADHHHVVAGGGAGGKAMGLVAAVREILKRSVEGKAIEGLQFFDRR